MEKEIWKEFSISKFVYLISNYGNIKNKTTGNIRKHKISKFGYHRIALGVGNYKKHFLIHRLVATLFIPNPNNLPQVNHIDGNKNNNYVGNLEWCSRKENMQHAHKLGLIKNENIRKSLIKRWVPIIAYKNGIKIGRYENIKLCCEDLGVFSANVNSVLKGKYKQTNGYTFKYANKKD